MTIRSNLFAIMLITLFPYAKLLASEARINTLDSGIWLIQAPSIFSSSAPNCLIPSRTEVIRPLTEEKDQVEMECVVLDTLVITESGARAAFIYTKKLRADASLEREHDQLFYIQTHEQVNCRDMTRRYTHDWYMNRFLGMPSKVGIASSREAVTWSQGVYANEDTEWSEWEAIVRKPSFSEKYLCSKWQAIKEKRFD